MHPRDINRRRVLIGGALAGTAAAVAGSAALHDGNLGAPPQTIRGAVPWREGTADAPPIAEGTGYRYFSIAEQGFIEPAIDRLIPPDENGPSATQANVHIFLDRQLAGPFGRGDHYYLGGPWAKGTPEQGYQSRLTPAQLYRSTIPAIETYAKAQHAGKTFRELTAADQDAVLKALDSGSAQLDGADAATFFAMFLQNVLEGYFSDPIYGGNKDMAAWKMIGFPGAHYDYREWVKRHGERVPFPQVSIKGRPGWSEG
jgi:gluconate 2-dehydrogenase gamma chain